jgi:hypothetical protein
VRSQPGITAPGQRRRVGYASSSWNVDCFKLLTLLLSLHRRWKTKRDPKQIGTTLQTSAPGNDIYSCESSLELLHGELVNYHEVCTPMQQIRSKYFYIHLQNSAQMLALDPNFLAVAVQAPRQSNVQPTACGMHGRFGTLRSPSSVQAGQIKAVRWRRDLAWSMRYPPRLWDGAAKDTQFN